MKTLYVTAEDIDGEDLGLIVRAETPEQALAYWREYYHFAEDETTCWDGSFVPGYPLILATDWGVYARVFEIQITDADVAGPLPWDLDDENNLAGQIVLLGHVPYTP